MHLLAKRAILALAILIAPNLALGAEIQQFLPGFRTIDGTHLNQMVDAINASGGTTPYYGCAADGATTDPVNCITLTGKGTGVRPIITTGGPSSDTNIGLAVAGKGTGSLLLGGTTTTLAGLQIAQPASRVNDIIITPGATGVVPIVASGGAGADANIGVVYGASGTGVVGIGGSTLANANMLVSSTASVVDHLTVTGGTTADPATVTAAATGTDTNVNIAVTPKGSGVVKVGGTIATCSGTTTATCQGQRFIASVTGLSTAPIGIESAAMTVTNASVVSASSIVLCNVNIYAGTGIPIATRITPGTGSVSFTITNVAGSGSLNATVPVACFVVGS